MKVGGKRTLRVPPNLAYGDQWFKGTSDSCRGVVVVTICAVGTTREPSVLWMEIASTDECLPCRRQDRPVCVDTCFHKTVSYFLFHSCTGTIPPSAHLEFDIELLGVAKDSQEEMMWKAQNFGIGRGIGIIVCVLFLAISPMLS